MGMAQDTDKLLDFVRAAKRNQISDEAVIDVLRHNGWSERRAYEALSDYYERDLGISIPSRGARVENARDAFYYLLAFITLGFWTVALILFADQFVDHAIPSGLDYTGDATWYRHAISYQVATLIISFPLFLFISRMIAKEVERRPEALESGVRKWLTYIALVITAITLVCDATWFLTTLLEGDLTVRFAWKAGVIFVVALGVFSYYLGIVRSEGIVPLRDRVYGWFATAAVVAALVLGFTSAGTPSQQRQYSLDEKRVDRLSSIVSSISARWSSQTSGKKHLPRMLADLNSDFYTIEDPETNQLFEYHPDGGSKYTLCATFNAAGSETNTKWKHPAGHYCYALDASANPY
jgi:hypothetical protein